MDNLEQIVIFTEKHRQDDYQSLESLLSYNQIKYRKVLEESEFVKAVKKKPKILLIDQFASSHALDDLLKLMTSKIKLPVIFFFATRDLSPIEEKQIETHNINIMAKPIIPIDVYERMMRFIE